MALLATEKNKIVVVDIREPAIPTIAGYIYAQGKIETLDLTQQDQIVIMTDQTGIQTLKLLQDALGRLTVPLPKLNAISIPYTQTSIHNVTLSPQEDRIYFTSDGEIHTLIFDLAFTLAPSASTYHGLNYQYFILAYDERVGFAATKSTLYSLDLTEAQRAPLDALNFNDRTHT